MLGICRCLAPMPNTLRVLVNLSHAVKWNSMGLSFKVSELEGLRTVLRKRYFLQRHQDDAVLGAVVVSQLKISFGEFRIPSNAIEEFVDWYHVRMLDDRG